VVTGASPGSLGFATARALADWGAEVVVTSRGDTSPLLDALSGVGRSVAGHRLDLTDRSSVERFADWFVRRHERLDVLVNNAGVHLDLRRSWREPRRTSDGEEVHWRTNYLGTMHLTHRLLPVLRRTAHEAGEARVVFVVSKLHARGRNDLLFAPVTPYDSWTAYGVSKLGLVHAAAELPRRYPELRGYALHPGAVFSHIADRGLEERRLLATVRRGLAPVERRLLLSPYQGAQTSLHCATAPGLPSGYYRACAPATPSREGQDRRAAARLWDRTREWIDAARPAP
jgi:NAD(P)-dependent dehydrogenase (short-subunit alcohol dehydrogenase family)